MAEIIIENLIKSFQIGNNILDGLSFTVNDGEHVGILGPNGCGKSTLFKIITGEIDYDDGSIYITKGTRIGLISQIPNYPKDWSTEDVLKDAQKKIFSIQSKLEKLTEKMSFDSSPSIMEEYDRLSIEFESLDGYNAEINRNIVANGLDINSTLRHQLFDNLSGGEKTRVNLARLILEDTDILLLDEPTNHLDMKSIEWLEDYVNHYKGIVLSISHDRYYLDKVCDRCIEISSGKAELYNGNYSFYVVERQRRFDEKLKQYEKDQAKIDQLTKAAEQMHLWAFMGNDKLHKRAFSMEKRIEKLSHSEKPKTKTKLNTKFKESSFDGTEVLVFDNVSKSFESKTLFSNINFLITGGEKIALIGNNGTGKSTLIKLILEQLIPDNGYIYTGPSIRIGYLPQIVQFQDENRNCVDTMLYEAKCTPQEARDRLASFGFRGESVLNSVKNLSGGERSRLKLCIEMGKNINFLILDEPTNHLDIDSREWIEDALSEYSEALLFVSHDRYFIDKFADRIWSLSNSGFTDYPGTYDDYIKYIEQQLVFSQIKKEKDRKIYAKPEKNKKNNTSKELSKTEKQIEKLEAKIIEIESLENKFSSDYQKLLELSDEKSKIESELEHLYEYWDELS